jgi:hypothetical protein
MTQASDLLGKGLSADVFDNGDGTVTKVYHADVPEHMHSDDYRKSLAVSKYYKNTPKVYGLKEGRPYPGIVFEKIQGVNMLQRIKQNPFGVFRYAREFARIHVGIGRTVAEDLPEQDSMIMDRIRLATGSRVDQATVISSLNAMPRGAFLCHNDFMPTNVICSDNGIVVIDWRTASIGDPCSDVARTLILHRVPRRDIGISLVEDFLRKIFISTYFCHYARVSGHSKAKVRKWLVPQAAVRLCEDVSEAERIALFRLIRRALKLHRQFESRSRQSHQDGA